MTVNQSQKPANNGMARLRILALFWGGVISCALTISVLSYWPFEIQLPSRQDIMDAVRTSPFSSEVSLIESLIERIPFFIFCAVLTGGIQKRPALRLKIVIWTLVVVLLLEAAQLFFVGRHARWSDITLGSLVCLSGLALGPKLKGLARLRNRVLATSLSGAALSAAAFVLANQGADLRTLSAWDCNFEVGIGNEAEMTRPWSGTLWSAEVSTPNNEVSLFPTALESAPLKVIPGKRYKANEISQAICEEIKAKQEFSIQASIASSGEQKTGPARIVSWSKSIYVQNFMLGEADHNIHFRIFTGPNSAMRMTEVTAPIPVEAGVPFSATGTYSNGRLTLSLNGVVVDQASVSDVRLNGGFDMPRGYLVSFMIALALFLFWDAIASAITLRGKKTQS
jgi:hypothetical protein